MVSSLILNLLSFLVLKHPSYEQAKKHCKMKNQRRRSIETLTVTSILHHDLIVQILLRLPVRSLLRFKSVCKSWLSLISDPKFGKSHFDLAASPTYRCLARGNDSEIESRDVNASLHNESSVVNLKYPLSSPPNQRYTHYDHNPVEFLGSCRGFLLVAYPWGDVFVWNPSTGVQKKIARIEELCFQVHGFGYDTSTNDYLLVLIQVIHLDDYRDGNPDVIADYPTRISLFSLKTNSWFHPQRESTNVQYVDLDSCEFQVGYLLNEALHWLVISYETKLHVIIAFDLAERSLSEIPVPQVLAMELEYKQYGLRVMGECLSLYCPGYVDSVAEIWMMKEYKVQSSWTRLFVYSTCNIPFNVFFPISFTKHGRIFGSNGNGRLMILNDKGWLHDLSAACPEPDKYHRSTNREDLLHCGMYRESLLSLPNDFEDASEDD